MQHICNLYLDIYNNHIHIKQSVPIWTWSILYSMDMMTLHKELTTSWGDASILLKTQGISSRKPKKRSTLDLIFFNMQSTLLIISISTSLRTNSFPSNGLSKWNLSFIPFSVVNHIVVLISTSRCTTNTHNKLHIITWTLELTRYIFCLTWSSHMHLQTYAIYVSTCSRWNSVLTSCCICVQR